MKNIYETINELRAYEMKQETALADYCELERQLVNFFKDYLENASVTSTSYGTGSIIDVCGADLGTMKITIDFSGNIKKFVLYGTNPKFLKVELLDFEETFSLARTLHEELISTYKMFQTMNDKLAFEAAKKADAAKKAEASYQRKKEQAIKDFNALAAKNKTVSATDDFYYALGWLAKHIGSMTAILPDYLGSAFEKYFGTEAPKTLVDSRAKTSGGYAKQWSWEFKCTIKKLKETVEPACIQSVTTDFSKGIHNTAFLWDLVSNYGFQFGKTQDLEKIKENIPTEYILSFEEGLSA